LTAKLVADPNSRPMEIPGARVVAKSRPQVKYVVDGRIREGANSREALDEALVVGNDGGDLRLLQHDFGHPDAIGGAVVLPWEVVTAVPGMPVEERARDGRG